MKTFSILWLIILCCYGVYFVYNKVLYLKEHPSVDLYANTLEFQILSFVLTRGLIGIGILIIIISIWNKKLG